MEEKCINLSQRILSVMALRRYGYGDFSIFFQDGDRRHLGFLNFQTFNGRNGQEGQTASPRQISWLSVKQLLRYDDFFRLFKMAAAATLDFKFSKF